MTEPAEKTNEPVRVIHPIIHCLLVGVTGSGKTQFASTFSKPMLVQFWDGYGNDAPFLKQGDAGELQYYEDGTPWREIRTPDGLIVIEYYHDQDPTHPDAFERYLGGLHYLDPTEWATVVFDSVSEAVKTARWCEQFTLNAHTKDKRSWWGAAADKVEHIISGTFKAFPCNVVVVAHLADKLPREDAPFWPLSLPGRLSTETPHPFGEVYLLRFVEDVSGNRRRVLQTEGDGTYFAKSHLDLPMYVEPHYENLWRKETHEVAIKHIRKERVQRKHAVTGKDS